MDNNSKLIFIGITLTLITLTSLTFTLIFVLMDEETSLTHCGPSQYLDVDTNTCILKSSIQPEVIVEEKIVETVIKETVPMKVIRGIHDKQNIFIVDNGLNPTVFLQTCNGLAVMNNPVLSIEDDGSYTLRDATAGMTIFVDKTSTHQYQITTVPYTGESFNTIGTELMRSDVFKVQCKDEVVKREVTRDVFYYDVELTNNDRVLRIDGDVGNIVGDKRNITGMIVLYENGRIKDHMDSFTINLSSSGEFFERIDVDGRTDSGKTWKDNKNYRVLISYDGKQITKDFRK